MREDTIERLRSRLITDLAELEQLGREWRHLAHSCALPSGLPGWQLAWWRHAAPVGAVLRAVAIFSNEDLVGLAPFFTVAKGRVDYRLLGAGLPHRLGLLIRPGCEGEAVPLVARALATAAPRPDLLALEGIEAAASWPDGMAKSWPGGPPWTYTSIVHPAPVLRLEGETYGSWLSTRSPKLREAIRRARRRADQTGAITRLVQDVAEVAPALEAFRSFYGARQFARGGSMPTEGEHATLSAAAPELIASGEMRLCVLYIEGRPAAVNIILAAGGEATGLRVTFDPQWARLQPGFVTLIAMIEHAFRVGDRRYDLGVGDEAYKLRLATDDSPVRWGGIVPRTRRYPLTRARLVPDQARWIARGLARKLPSEHHGRLKRVLRRR